MLVSYLINDDFFFFNSVLLRPPFLDFRAQEKTMEERIYNFGGGELTF